MKVYEYTVCTVTSKGRKIPHFNKVIKTKMDIVDTAKFLNEKYTGFYVKVDNVVDIEEIEKSKEEINNNIDIVEKYSQKCIVVKKECKEFPELNKELREALTGIDNIRTKIKDKVKEYLKNEIKFNGILDTGCTIEGSKILITGYLPLYNVVDLDKNETTI